MPQNSQNKVVIGCLGSVFGVRGQLKVHSYTDPITNILNYPVWQIQHQGQWQALPIEKVGLQGSLIIVKIKGVDDRDIAKMYTNDLIAIERSELPPTADNEYYWDDLIDMTVVTTTGVTLGSVIEMRDTGANDILIIKGERRHLVPFIDSVICSVDRDNKQITVDWDHEF